MGRNSARASGEIEMSPSGFHYILTFLQIVVSEQEQMENLLTEMEKVTQIVSRCKLYEIMYLNSVQVEDTVRPAFKDLEAALVKLYTAILKVLAEAYDAFDKSGIRRVLRLTLYDNQLSRLDTDVIVCADTCKQVYCRNSHESARENLRTLRDLEQSIQYIGSRVRILLRRVGTERRIQILQWISPIHYKDSHNAACKEHTSGTGKWLLKHQMYQNWKVSRENSILWLHGIREKPIPNLLCVVC